jgi:hypothetical protein
MTTLSTPARRVARDSRGRGDPLALLPDAATTSIKNNETQDYPSSAKEKQQ